MFDNAVDVVELLLVQTDQVPNVLHLRVLHTFSSMTSLELLIQQSVEEVVKEICPRGNNKVVIYISLYHDKCLLFMLELYLPET